MAAGTKNSKRNFWFSGYFILLIIVIVAGAFLRFYQLGAESYWIDEMSTVIEGQQTIPQLLASGRLDQPPAFYIPFHYWEKVAGTSETATRSFSVLIGTACIAVLYLIGRELFGKTVGLVGAFLMAISEFQIYYSQITRYYIFFELLTLLSILFLILSLGNKKPAFYCCYVIATVLMLYSHTFGVFILAAENLFFFLHTKKYRELLFVWFICQGLILLAFLPYFYFLVLKDGGVQGEVALNSGGTLLPSLTDPIKTLYRFVMPARRDRSWENIIVVYIIALTVLVGGTWLYLLKSGFRKLGDLAGRIHDSLGEIPEVYSKVILLGCWLLCPILLPFLASFLIAPMYTDRYMVSASPALYLLLGLALVNISRIIPLRVSLIVIMIMIIPGLQNYYAADVNEQWREVAQYVQSHSTPDETIVFAPNMGIGIQQKTFDWYYQGDLPECGLANADTTPPMILKDLKDCIVKGPKFWVIIYGSSESSSLHRYQSFFLSDNYINLTLIDDQPFTNLHLYLFEAE